MLFLKKMPTLALRAIALGTAAMGAVLCIFAIPAFGSGLALFLPELSFLRYPLLAGLYAAAGCFYYSLFQFWRLLDAVEKTGEIPKKKLKAIRKAAVAFSILYFVFAMPVIFLAANADDAPGLVIIGAFMEVFPLGSAAVCAVLERVDKG